MRRRLAASYILLLVCVLAALEVPLAVGLTGWDTQRLVASRLADAVRLAEIVEPGVRDGNLSMLNSTLAQYDFGSGSPVALLDRNGDSITASRIGLPLRDREVTRVFRQALAGRPTADERSVWPWRSEPLVAAAPVLAVAGSLAVVVIIAPVNAVADGLVSTYAWLLLGGSGALLTGTVGAWYLAGRTLRPLTDLTGALAEATAGRVPSPVSQRRRPGELAQITQLFNGMTHTVAEVLDRQRMFILHASHQLRTPLTVLRLRVEDLGPELATEEAQEDHRLALEEAQRLGLVLNGLLSLASVDRGAVEAQQVDAGEVAAARVIAWQPVARRNQITLRYSAPARRTPVFTAPTALDQALDALIDNAMKFCTVGCEIVVRVDAPEQDGAGVEVHVADDGPGMSPEQRARATEQFWRAPDQQHVDGFGLGLPIVAVLVEASHGRLDLLPADPHGLDARIWLPIAPPQDP